MDFVRRYHTLHVVQLCDRIVKELEHSEDSVVRFNERVNVRLEAAHYELTTRV